MIGFLEGTVRAIRDGYCILMCGGVGYRVFISGALLASLKPDAPLSLWTHLAVREDAQELYGFVSEEELRFFELLLAVPGVGPRSALAVLDIASVETLRSAIVSGRAEYLTKITGIGRKKAEKIVLELRDKIGAVEEVNAAALRGDEGALDAMRHLGYSLDEARSALRAIPAEIEGESARLREALKLLGQRAS